jgi:DNA polymerase-3 subunit epsilon
VAFGDNLLKETVAYTAVDVETTGFGVKDRVIAVGLAMFGESGTLLATWSTLINPGRDAGPVQVHGITNEMLKGEYRFEQVAAELSELLSGRLVAHNAAFDKRMLESEYERAGLKLPDWDFTCTMQFAKRTLKGNTSFKLEAVRETLGLPPHKAHSALDDAIAAGEDYAALQERI